MFHEGASRHVSRAERTVTEPDREQFREFVQACGGRLFRVALALAGDRHAAEDLLQHVLTRTCARWRHVRENPEGYVRRALYHAQVSTWRRYRRLREVPVDVLPEPPVGDEMAAADIRVAVRQALRRLPPRQRAVLVARFLEDLPEQETAELLGCSIGTVRSQLHRALARLRVIAPELRPIELPAGSTR
jgi:RNA polymerase sigma-70 factor (sigma-E family)